MPGGKRFSVDVAPWAPLDTLGALNLSQLARNARGHLERAAYDVAVETHGQGTGAGHYAAQERQHYWREVAEQATSGLLDVAYDAAGVVNVLTYDADRAVTRILRGNDRP